MPSRDRSRDIVISIAEAAAMCGVGPSTWAKLRKQGLAPPLVRLSERRIGHRRGDVEDWLAARTEAAA